MFFVHLSYKGLYWLFLLKKNNIFTVYLTIIPLCASLSELNIFRSAYTPKYIRYYTTFSNLSHNNYPRVHCEEPAKPVVSEGSNSLNPWFITGFVDAEGTFVIKVSKSPRSRAGWRVEAIFIIGLHQKDFPLLE